MQRGFALSVVDAQRLATRVRTARTHRGHSQRHRKDGVARPPQAVLVSRSRTEPTGDADLPAVADVRGILKGYEPADGTRDGDARRILQLEKDLRIARRQVEAHQRFHSRIDTLIGGSDWNSTVTTGTLAGFANDLTIELMSIAGI
jgi:hypothetical protein